MTKQVIIDTVYQLLKQDGYSAPMPPEDGNFPKMSLLLFIHAPSAMLFATDVVAAFPALGTPTDLTTRLFSTIETVDDLINYVSAAYTP